MRVGSRPGRSDISSDSTATFLRPMASCRARTGRSWTTAAARAATPTSILMPGTRASAATMFATMQCCGRSEDRERFRFGTVSPEDGRMSALPWPDNTFDFVFATSVFEHVRDQDTAYAEICRVLKPGAVFLNNFPVQVATDRAAHVSSRSVPPPRPSGGSICGPSLGCATSSAATSAGSNARVATMPTR